VRMIISLAAVILLLLPVSRTSSALQSSDNISPVTFLRMISTEIGWAQTDICDPCPSNVISGLMLRSTDGGTRWQNVSPLNPSGNRIEVGDIYRFAHVGGFYALNSQTAWVRGYRTDDGGRIWKRVSQTPVYQYFFINPREGWGIAPLASAMQVQEAEIYRSTDGGETWIKVASTHDSGSGLPFGGFKRSITFLNSTTGWIARDYAGNFTPNLFFTKDGGRTWRQQELPTPSKYSREFEPWPPKFFTAQDGVVRFDYSADDPGSDPIPFSVFYATHDGGSTWTPATPVAWRKTPSMHYTIPSSDFVSVNQGWLKQADTLSTTNDGGRNWRTISLDPLLERVIQLNFISPEVGWAVRDAGGGRQTGPVLLKTLNGGRTWVPVPYTITGQ
jgi:photosystem II stability/assembly factor-like uncharacterized protein